MKAASSLAVLGLAGGLAGNAAAADMGIPAPPATAVNWTGLYAGVSLGATWRSAPPWTSFNPNNGARFSLTGPGEWGALAGVFSGCDWQSGAIVLGLEGDVSWTSLGQTRTVPTIGVGSFARMSADDAWLGSLRGRIGFAGWSNALFYLTGGLAAANIEDSGHMTRFIGAAEYVADAAATTVRPGWAAGGGAEWMVDPRIALRLEYLHYELGNNPTLTGPISPGVFIPVRFTWSNYRAEVVRAGMSYKF